jgi:NAD(P)-dependent dehydrogenase (short-subunit alcohol dehydrogenase family)
MSSDNPAANCAAAPRLAVVSGAGSGLGRAFCLQIAMGPPCHIVAMDVDHGAAAETLVQAERLGAVRGEVAAIDVADADAWRALRARLQRDWPRLDLLVNNAGVCLAAEFGGDNLAAWRRLMEVNYFGVLHGCHEMTAWLKWSARNRASSAAPPAVINVASVVGWLAGPSMGAYCASKAAVIALSEALYAELRPAGVNVTVVAPGFFRTGLLDRGEFCTTRHRAEAERLSRRARFTAANVAHMALRASQRGQLYAVMGARARWLWRLKRLAPRLVHRIVARRYHRTFAGVGDDVLVGIADDVLDGVGDDPARNRVVESLLNPEP